MSLVKWSRRGSKPAKRSVFFAVLRDFYCLTLPHQKISCMKPSVFDPSSQHLSRDSKIVVALERIAEAFRVLLWSEGKALGLSPIQIQILIFLRFHTKEKCKVGYLAQEFNLTKATVSEAVKSLEDKRLITKEPELSDSRSYTICLTSEGNRLAERTSSFAETVERPVSEMTEMQKEVLLASLLELIFKLQKAGIIGIQRMCATCRFYGKDQYGGGTHFCNLLQMPLQTSELRIDCPEHEAA